MNVIVCGAGEVGRHAASVLTAAGHDITIIDKNLNRLRAIEEALDVRVLHGNGTHAESLAQAGCRDADVMIAATQEDETNLLSASVSKKVGARMSIARVHHRAYFNPQELDYAKHLGIDHLVCPEYTTAEAIAQFLRNPSALAVERFAKGTIEMQQLPVDRGAPAVGARLSDIELPESVLLTAIERQGQPFLPDAETVVHADDVVTLVGEVAVFGRAVRKFHTRQPTRRNVIVFGGSPQGVWLSRVLKGRHFTLRLFEPNRDRAEELAAKLDWVTVYRIDPTDEETAGQERIGEADTFVSVTGDDEQNILAAAYAKNHLGANRSIVVVKRPTYRRLIETIGVDRAFSPRETAVREIQRLLARSSVQQLSSFAGGIAKILELRVEARARRILQKPLAEIPFPDRTLVIAIQRKGRVWVPGAQDLIKAGDTCVVIVPSDRERQIKQLFEVA